MKITKKQLQNIILEEIKKELNEFNPYHIAAAVGHRNNNNKSSSDKPRNIHTDDLDRVLKIRKRIMRAVEDKEYSTEEKLEIIKGAKEELEKMRSLQSEVAEKSRKEYIDLAEKMIQAVLNRAERGKKFTGKIKNWWQEFSERPEEWKE